MAEDPDSGTTFGARARDDEPATRTRSGGAGTLPPIDDGFAVRDGIRFAQQWLPRFEQPGGARDEDLAAFIDALYEDDVLVVFDWIEWRDQGHVLLETSGAMERADLDDFRRLLTMLVRQDKFAEGTLAHAVEQGWLHATLACMAQL